MRRVVVILGDAVVLMYIGNWIMDSFVEILYAGRLGIICGKGVVVVAVVVTVGASVVVCGVEVVMAVVVVSEAIVEVVGIDSSKSLSAMTIMGGLIVLLSSNFGSVTGFEMLFGSLVGIVHRGNVEQSRSTVITIKMTTEKDARVILHRVN